MAYGIRNLRQQNLMDGYDQLTPGAAQYGEDYSNPTSPYTPGPSPGLESVGAQQDNNAILDPTGQPLQQESPIQAPTIEAPRVDPNSGRTLQDYLKQMNEAYTPDYTSRDRLNRLLEDAPTRQAPGWGRALVAAGMSIKADDPIATSEKVMYAPYMRDVEEWKTRADPYYKAAELENRQNINERTLMANAATAHAAAERTRVTEEKNRETAENNRIRSEAYAFKQMHPNWTIKTDGPNVMAYNPQNPSAPPINLGPSGKMSQIDLENLKGEYRVEAARQTGADAMARTQVAGAETYVDPATNQPRVVNPRTGEGMGGGPIRKPTTSGSTTSQLEKNRVEQETMKQQRATDPGAKDHMKPDGKGGYTWKDRPIEGSVVNGWFGTGIGGHTVTKEDVDAYDAYRLEANPEYKPRIKGLGPGKTPDTDKPTPRVRAMPDDQGAGMDAGQSGAPAPGKGIAGGTGPDYKLRRNPKNPNEMARTLDGKTWQKSVDGGKTWR